MDATQLEQAPGRPDTGTILEPGQHLTDEAKDLIRALSLSGKYTQRQIALRVGTTPQSVNAILRETREVAKLMLDSAAISAAKAVVGSFRKRPGLAMDYLDRKKLIEAPQTAQNLQVPTIIFQTTGNVGVAFTLPHLPSSPQASLSPPIIEGETAKHDENIE